ncbi:hypothetical protein FRC14_006364 [Serendipita sp. 396]|nr:hypothetical protein FRC14_006364 [Serendipita sp. 396]KAG8772855.1 hypothetical protein FRC16_005545 [Serendipita sp. 398]KAG8779329.1 hypothetical protein FRC15_010245 [Serendipita sp. 397]KAG8849438.1 hypothetical protein FRB91_009955 [Serendipita sp. 411]KAG9058546.1 hypothetical protein FS842_008843 [Serendipita sp. 407]
MHVPRPIRVAPSLETHISSQILPFTFNDHDIPAMSAQNTIKIDEIPTSDKVILVIGPTGSGKSTFINYAAGGNGSGSEICSGLKPCTKTMRLTSVCFKGGQSIVTSASIASSSKLGGSTTERTIWFVDTPGLNVSDAMDTRSFNMIAQFLIPAQTRGLQLEILYLHRITDNRTADSPLRHLQLLATFCPNIPMPNTIIVTTMWSNEFDKERGRARQTELANEFANSETHKGCKFAGFQDSYESVYGIIFNQEKDRRPILSSKPQLVVKQVELTLPKMKKGGGCIIV